MLYYAKDHALKQPFGKILSSIEEFLAIAHEESRPPIDASIRTSECIPRREEHQAIRSNSMQLKRGFEFQGRVDAILEQVRDHSSNPNCSFGVRWVPDFHGPATSSFGILGIDGLERQEGGAFAHFIQLSGTGTRSTSPNWAMLYLALPFEYNSDAFHEFTERANSVLCFSLSPKSFRQLTHSKNGKLKTAKLTVSATEGDS